VKSGKTKAISGTNQYFLSKILTARKQLNNMAVADPAMGGQGGRPPIDQNLGLVMAARLRHGGKFSRKSLTFGQFFV